MANQYVNSKPQGFTSSTKQPSSEAPSISSLTKPIAHQQHLLENLETNMDQMGDEFANRAAEIIEQGIQNSYVKAADRIRAIELPFFGLKGDGSYFASSRNVPTLKSAAAEETC
jgi:hypothetical protein